MTARSDEQAADRSTRDRFGNVLDPEVGYARGAILSDRTRDGQRMRRAWSLTRAWVAEHGPHSLRSFTGTAGEFAVAAEDLWMAGEWEGTGVFADELRDRGLAHLGGSAEHGFGMVGRTSAGVLAFVAMHAPGGTVWSVVPRGGHAHSSVGNAARLVGATLREVEADELGAEELGEAGAGCVVVTAVTSSLEFLTDTVLRRTVDLAHRAGLLVMIDDAYGARMRPILLGGSASLSFGADVVLTNTDKAGLRGPRAALLAGGLDAVEAILGWTAERGMDARTPVMLAALGALRRFEPDDLRRESEEAIAFGSVLVSRLGPDVVQHGIMGPTIGEEDALDLLRRGGRQIDLVPAEASTAIAMMLLKRHGIATVTTHGQPGARVSLRLKPVLGAVAKAGGAVRVTDEVEAAIEEATLIAGSRRLVCELLLGHAEHLGQ